MLKLQVLKIGQIFNFFAIKLLWTKYWGDLVKLKNDKKYNESKTKKLKTCLSNQ